MKRFMLFAYDHYHPQGGMHDFVGDFDTTNECHTAIKQGYDVQWTADNGMRHCEYEKAHIYDTETGQIIETYLAADSEIAKLSLKAAPKGWQRVYA